MRSSSTRRRPCACSPVSTSASSPSSAVGQRGGGAASVQVRDDGPRHPVADPESRAAVAEQPAGAAGHRAQRTVLNVRGDRPGAGDEDVAARGERSRAEHGQQVGLQREFAVQPEGDETFFQLLSRHPRGGAGHGDESEETTRGPLVAWAMVVASASAARAGPKPAEIGFPPPDCPNPRQFPDSSTMTARVEVPPASIARIFSIVVISSLRWACGALTEELLPVRITLTRRDIQEMDSQDGIVAFRSRR